MTSYHLLICTGASSGIGEALVVAMAEAVNIPLHVIVTATARSAQLLTNVCTQIETIRSDKFNNIITECTIHLADLSSPIETTAASHILFPRTNERIYSHITFINNAGSVQILGNVGLPALFTMESMSQAIQLNVTSSLFLTSEFVSFYHSLANKPKAVVVNVSSLCATGPFASMATYCAGQSASQAQ